MTQVILDSVEAEMTEVVAVVCLWPFLEKVPEPFESSLFSTLLPRRQLV
jgi:hypothetical protein